MPPTTQIGACLIHLIPLGAQACRRLSSVESELRTLSSRIPRPEINFATNSTFELSKWQARVSPTRPGCRELHSLASEVPASAVAPTRIRDGSHSQRSQRLLMCGRLSNRLPENR